MDPKGYHSIICTDNGDNYYVGYRDNRVRYLQGVKGKVVKSIAWNDQCVED